MARREAGGSYSEAAILTCAALSALAAEVWPGQRIDRVRFIELLVRLGPSPTLASIVSVPLLVRHLESTPEAASAALLKNKLLGFSPTRIVTGTEVDRSESELLALCPTLSPRIMRKHSYACLLYEEVRSSYAHEYRPGNKSDSWPMTVCNGESVSYVNRLLTAGIPETVRLIHFHLSWLTKLAIDLATNIDTLRATLPRPVPSTWWIDGAP